MAGVALLASCASREGTSAPPSIAGVDVVGIVTSIQASSPAQVTSFTLRTDSGQVLTFELGRVPLSAGSFPPGHLHDHLASAQPVVVSYFPEGGRLVAYHLRDGP
jgi:hypothetical protein